MQEKPGQTLQATALVDEAYLRLVDQDQRSAGTGRGHFFAAAAEAMRRILVEAARYKARQKRGGGFRRVELADYPVPDPDSDDRPPRPRRRANRLADEDPWRLAWSSFAGSPAWATRTLRLRWECLSTSLARSGPMPGRGSATPSGVIENCFGSFGGVLDAHPMPQRGRNK